MSPDDSNETSFNALNHFQRLSFVSHPYFLPIYPPISPLPLHLTLFPRPCPGALWRIGVISFFGVVMLQEWFLNVRTEILEHLWQLKSSKSLKVMGNGKTTRGGERELIILKTTTNQQNGSYFGAKNTTKHGFIVVRDIFHSLALGADTLRDFLVGNGNLGVFHVINGGGCGFDVLWAVSGRGIDGAVAL